MRVTRESLIRIAKETAQERAFNERDIIAAYLTGSLVSSEVDPMLGGTADIDIIFVHAEEPKHRREFVTLTPDFHLDISHRAKAEFKRPRELRLDPWLGWEMYDPMLLYEREKFFEFIQAGLRAGFEFNAPAPALQRSRLLLSQARRMDTRIDTAVFHRRFKCLSPLGNPIMDKRVIQMRSSQQAKQTCIQARAFRRLCPRREFQHQTAFLQRRARELSHSIDRVIQCVHIL